MLANLDGWDLALLAMAAYVAVVGLVRLMVAWRNTYLERMHEKLRSAEAAGVRPRQAARGEKAA